MLRLVIRKRGRALQGRGTRREWAGGELRAELTVGCEAELDDGEDELDDAHGEDPVDGHFNGLRIYSIAE